MTNKNLKKKLIMFIIVTVGSVSSAKSDPATAIAIIIEGAKVIVVGGAKLAAAGFCVEMGKQVINRTIPNPHDKLIQEKIKYEVMISKHKEYRESLHTENTRLEELDKVYAHCKDSSLTTNECEQYRVFRDELKNSLLFLIKNRPNSEYITQKNN